MLKLLGLHHVASIYSNYAVSKRFYIKILSLEVLADTQCAAIFRTQKPGGVWPICKLIAPNAAQFHFFPPIL